MLVLLGTLYAAHTRRVRLHAPETRAYGKIKSFTCWDSRAHRSDKEISSHFFEIAASYWTREVKPDSMNDGVFLIAVGSTAGFMIVEGFAP